MDDALRQLVRSRANERCEYCHLPQRGHEERFSVDHVVARKHGGEETAANLALCCLRCNLHKGTNLSGVDSQTGAIAELFNPRQQEWRTHFRWSGSLIVGTTPQGRATVAVLGMNLPERVRFRDALIREGLLTTD